MYKIQKIFNNNTLYNIPDVDGNALTERLNGKGLIVIFGSIDSKELPENQKELLSKMMQACGQSISEIELLHELEVPTLSAIKNENLKTILLFGVKPSDMGLQKEVTFYLEKRMFDLNTIWSDSLEELAMDVNKKRQLWGALKSYFNV